MTKYYAVKKGRKTGVFTTWANCQEQIKGYSGAIYKSFATKSEAEAFVKGDSAKKTKLRNEDSLIAYVDGSFDKKRQAYGSGIVLLKGNTILEELSIPGKHKEFTESYQIAGEVFGVLEAVSWAIKHQYSDIEIHYDYEGIEKWALGYWRANKPVSQYYVEAFKPLSKKIDVSFTKVKAHSGDTYNDLADELAKKATQIEAEPVRKEASDAENQLLHVEGHNNDLYMNLLIDGKLVDYTTLYNLITSQWQQQGYLLADLKEIKVIFDVDEEQLIAAVIDVKNDVEYLSFDGSQLTEYE
ncbi:hypothetical protein NRIC_00090 [Enterococcus florum]|uniref:ribonuclease H n=1 Tax=Enterococcus florum TaxID=2480627 RepID=A0A4P5P861_9ENTE|nr:ribonuclease H family protein [Enterococcus florum]GCF92118.1 hypothetical protein NRIC_00090 [Enterococcus florum]